MSLVNREGQWYWRNWLGLMQSPRFDSKARADEWYSLHDNWLERPAIL